MKKRHSGFQVGQRIKAYDFEPMPGRDERYVIGTIKEAIDDPKPGEIPDYACYYVIVEEDTLFPEEPRTTVFVPMEIYPGEYKDRITLV